MFTRCYAFMYGRISRGSERAGLRDERAALRASRSAALPRTHARRGSEDREETGRPAVPLLLDGVPSEPATWTRSPVRSCLSWPFAVVRSRRHP